MDSDSVSRVTRIIQDPLSVGVQKKYTFWDFALVVVVKRQNKKYPSTDCQKGLPNKVNEIIGDTCRRNITIDIIQVISRAIC